MMRGATLKINGDRGQKKVRLRVDYADVDDPYLPKMSKNDSSKRRGDDSRNKDSDEPKRRRQVSRSKSTSPPPKQKDSSKVLLHLLIYLPYQHDAPRSCVIILFYSSSY